MYLFHAQFAYAMAIRNTSFYFLRCSGGSNSSTNWYKCAHRWIWTEQETVIEWVCWSAWLIKSHDNDLPLHGSFSPTLSAMHTHTTHTNTYSFCIQFSVLMITLKLQCKKYTKHFKSSSKLKSRFWSFCEW